MFKKMQNRKGFTLIEMMAVIAIVAVLVAVIVPTVAKAQNKAKGAADAANLRSLSASVATRYVSTTEADELVAGLQNPGSQLFDGSHVLFYRDGNEIHSYFSQSIINAGHLRGDGYNGFVAETGDLDKAQYDPAKGELLCVLTSNGESIASNVYNELVDAITNAYTDAYDSIYEEKYQGYYDQYLDNLVQTQLDIFRPTLNEMADSIYADTLYDTYVEDYLTKAYGDSNFKVGIGPFQYTKAQADKYGMGALWEAGAQAEAAKDFVYYQSGVSHYGDATNAESKATAAKDNYINSSMEEKEAQLEAELKGSSINQGLADGFASGQVGMEAAGQAGQQVEDAYNNAGNIIGSDALQDQVEAETNSAIRDVINSIIGNN